MGVKKEKLVNKVHRVSTVFQATMAPPVIRVLKENEVPWVHEDSKVWKVNEVLAVHKGFQVKRVSKDSRETKVSKVKLVHEVRLVLLEPKVSKVIKVSKEKKVIPEKL